MEDDAIFVGRSRIAESVVRQRYVEQAAKDSLWRKQQIAQRKSAEATTQHLIQSSLAAINIEAAVTIIRLRAKNWPNGRLENVVRCYEPVYTGWLRKRLIGHLPVEEELAVWHIALDDIYRASAKLGSDGRIYFYSRMVIDGRHYDMGYHPINMPGNAFFIYSNEEKRIKISDDEIRSRVKKTIQALRKIGIN